MRNRKAVIAGGLGFIGSNLAKRLVKEGTEVWIVDALIPEQGGNLFNIRSIKGRVRVFKQDVRKASWKKIL